METITQPDVAHVTAVARSGFDLAGQRVLLVGGASGLGEALAIGFSGVGARVAIADVNFARADILAATLQDAGRDVRAWPLDVRNPGEVEAVIAEIGTVMGGLDVAVNLTGVNDRRPALDLDSEAFSRVLGVNLEGVYACARAEGKIMTAAGAGSIINVSSIYAVASPGHQAAYAASKGGVLSLTKVLASEWAMHGVRVNALVPGPILTPLSKANLIDSPETRAWMEARIMRHSAGEPSEIVGPAIFLASNASSFVTGIGLPVDGGWLAS